MEESELAECVDENEYLALNVGDEKGEVKLSTLKDC